MNDNKIMKEEMAKHLEKGFLLICIVCAFCIVVIIVAGAYYIIIGSDNVFELVFKCIVIPLGVVGVYKVVKGVGSWMDK